MPSGCLEKRSGCLNDVTRRSWAAMGLELGSWRAGTVQSNPRGTAASHGGSRGRKGRRSSFEPMDRNESYHLGE